MSNVIEGLKSSEISEYAGSYKLHFLVDNKQQNSQEVWTQEFISAHL